MACGARSELVLPTPVAVDAAPTFDATPSDASPDVTVLDAPEEIPPDASSDEAAPPADCGIPCEPVGAPPRPIAPLSTATVSSQRPRLRWDLALDTDGAQVDLCADRACEMRVTSFIAAGSSGAPPTALAPGLYFWRLRPTLKGYVGTATSPIWEFVVRARSAPIDTSWGTFLDYNGDGFADVAVGAMNNRANLYNANVFAYPGGTGGLSTAAVTKVAFPGATNSNFQAAVASAGDVNGDGFADLVIGSGSISPLSAPGSAYVMLGGIGGLDPSPVMLTSSGAYGFGLGVSSAGDVNGDGYADVLVSESYELNAAGNVYLYLGGPTGLSTTPTMVTRPASASGARFGASLGGACDINGDGYADVVLGCFLYGDPNVGAFLYLGGPAGLGPPVAVPPAGAAFGPTVACAGDTNGDGYSDLLVGAPYGNSGDPLPTVSLYLGGPMGLTSPPQTLATQPGEFGESLSIAGDVNGDGYDDALIGGGPSTAWVYYGGASGLASTPAVIQSPADAGLGSFGSAVSGAGDIDHDGFADFVVGAWYAQNANGGVVIYFGEKSLLSRAPEVMEGPGGGVNFYGMSVARNATGWGGRARVRR
jgi:hypothetical protein